MDLIPDSAPAPAGRPVLEPWQRANFERGLHTATTVLEALFWGWLLQLPGSARLFWEEIQISPLEGPGGVPDDFVGDHPSPEW